MLDHVIRVEANTFFVIRVSTFIITIKVAAYIIAISDSHHLTMGFRTFITSMLKRGFI